MVGAEDYPVEESAVEWFSHGVSHCPSLEKTTHTQNQECICASSDLSLICIIFSDSPLVYFGIYIYWYIFILGMTTGNSCKVWKAAKISPPFQRNVSFCYLVHTSAHPVARIMHEGQNMREKHIFALIVCNIAHHAAVTGTPASHTWLGTMLYFTGHFKFKPISFLQILPICHCYSIRGETLARWFTDSRPS